MTAVRLIRYPLVLVLPLVLWLPYSVHGLEQEPAPLLPQLPNLQAEPDQTPSVEPSVSPLLPTPPSIQEEPDTGLSLEALAPSLLPPPAGVAPATHAFLSAALATGASDALDDRRRALLRAYFSTAASLAELAPLAGVRSRQRVQQLLLSGLRTLWERLPAPLQQQYPLADVLRLKTTRGRAPSTETRAKLGAARRGKPLAPDTKAKLRAAHQGQPSPMQGRQHTPEARAKMSAAKQGRELTAETRAKISAAKRGRSLPAETRAKISATLTGRHISPETRAMLREAQHARTPASTEHPESRGPAPAHTA